MADVKISVDTSQVDKELRRLMEAPDMKTVMAFNGLFAEVAAEVDALIHIETGSLKSTARWDSPSFPTGWQGALHAGGAAPGEIRDPAYYGVYELARGATHFFFAPAYADIPPKMIDIMLNFYSGGDSSLITSDFTPSTGGAGKTAAKSAEASAKRTSKTAVKKVDNVLSEIDRKIKSQHAKEFPSTVKPSKTEDAGDGGHEALFGSVYYPSKMTGRSVESSERIAKSQLAEGDKTPEKFKGLAAKSSVLRGAQAEDFQDLATFTKAKNRIGRRSTPHAPTSKARYGPNGFYIGRSS